MREANVAVSGQKQMVCKVTKRSGGREITDVKVFQELQRLGVSPTILDSLKTAQENRQEGQKGVTGSHHSESKQ